MRASAPKPPGIAGILHFGSLPASNARGFSEHHLLAATWRVSSIT
jgi:hypothetical protein